MIQSFQPYVDSQTEILILGNARFASLEKQGIMHTKSFFGEYCMILNAMPISEMFEEKIQVLQANKIGLWDVLEKCETRKFRHSYQKTKGK
jgi:hypothetical protein